MKYIVTITLLLLIVGTVVDSGWAEAEEALITDRPDITESSQAVGRGILQVETSVQLRRFEAQSVETDIFSTPTLFRFGVGRSLELRLGTDAYSVADETGPLGASTESSGFGPIFLGAKYHMMEPTDGSSVPSFGVLVFVELPSGSSTFRTRLVSGGLLLAADGDLSERFSWGANAGVTALERDTGDPRGAASLSAALGVSLSDRFGGFAEFAVAGLGLPDDERVSIADAGVTFLVSPNAQFDLAAGAGLTDPSPDFFVTLGFSFRAPLL